VHHGEQRPARGNVASHGVLHIGVGLGEERDAGRANLGRLDGRWRFERGRLRQRASGQAVVAVSVGPGAVSQQTQGRYRKGKYGGGMLQGDVTTRIVPCCWE
jgi:hypothetical protein